MQPGERLAEAHKFRNDGPAVLVSKKRKAAASQWHDITKAGVLFCLGIRIQHRHNAGELAQLGQRRYFIAKPCIRFGPQVTQYLDGGKRPILVRGLPHICIATSIDAFDKRPVAVPIADTRVSILRLHGCGRLLVARAFAIAADFHQASKSQSRSQGIEAAAHSLPDTSLLIVAVVVHLAIAISGMFMS